MPIDIREYIVPEASELVPTKKPDGVSRRLEKLLPQKGKAERYLAVKIPFSWLSAAGSLTGKALAVGLFAWWLVTVKKKAIVALSCSKAAKLFDVSTETIRRAVHALEAAGLLKVTRGSGSSPKIQIVSAPEPANFGEEKQMY